MDSNWSYRKLVKEYGEDIAILLLEFMEGLGEFEHNISRWSYEQDTPYDEVYDNIPIKFQATPLTEYNLDYGASGVEIRLWRKKSENGLST